MAKKKDTPTTRRHDLTPSQAQALSEIAARKQAVEREWDLALKIAGFEPGQVAGGNLADDPHFMVMVDDLSD